MSAVFAPVQIIGYVAYALSFYACFQKNDNKMFRFLAYTWGLFAVHNFMAGNLTAASSGAVLAVRMFLSQYYKGAKMAYPFAILAIIFALPTYQSLYSLLPLTAVLIGTFGSAYCRGIWLRVAFMSGCTLWLIHNIAMRSWGALAYDITTILMHTLTCLRIYREKKKAAGQTEQDRQSA